MLMSKAGKLSQLSICAVFAGAEAEESRLCFSYVM